jgi:hypothetical protein
LKRLVEVARRERIVRVYADILSATRACSASAIELGFTLDPMPDAGVIPAVLELARARADDRSLAVTRRRDADRAARTGQAVRPRAGGLVP